MTDERRRRACFGAEGSDRSKEGRWRSAGPAARWVFCALGACAARDETELVRSMEARGGSSDAASTLESVTHAAEPEPQALTPFALRCGEGGLTRRGANDLSRLPYLQRVTATSAAILYARRADRALADAVEITQPDGTLVTTLSAQVDPAAPGGLQRVAYIQGLKPLTYYCYRLIDLTARIGFRTAPLPDTAAVVRFAVFGDSGNASLERISVRDRLEVQPIDLVLHTGDIAYEEGTREQLEQSFFGIYQNLLESVPVFPVPGNHEYVTDSAGPYLEVFDLPGNGVPGANERWYSFDWGDVHFVALDTEQVRDQQVGWLERDLAANRRSWTVVYLHKPPYSSGFHGGSALVEDAFVPAFQRHGVQLVFAGHDHHYERTLPMAGVTYVVTGGGGKSLRAVGGSEFTAYSESVMHFVGVEVNGVRMRGRAIDAAGREIDAFEITR
jgi:hypothetical protein